MTSKTENGRAKAVEALQARLGHTFRNTVLLEQALTHTSVGQTPSKVRHGERLEFLGDRVLGLCIAEVLLERYPADPEGELSKRLNILVSGRQCAGVAREIGLGAALRMAGGETRSGLRENDTVLGDACEALIAAVYLDGGLEAAAAAIRRLWAERLDEVETRGVLNPKSALQEWAAAEKRSAPAYRVVSRTGPDHAPEFTIEVEVAGIAPETAIGGSRQQAETAAALKLLKREGVAP
jgi:ribonuclease-3